MQSEFWSDGKLKSVQGVCAPMRQFCPGGAVGYRWLRAVFTAEDASPRDHRFINTPHLPEKVSATRSTPISRSCSEGNSGAILAYYPCHHVAKKVWRRLGLLLAPVPRESYTTHCEMARRANKGVMLKAPNTYRIIWDHARKYQLRITCSAAHRSHSLTDAAIPASRRRSGSARS
jgi:hypothetical protein